MFISKMRKTTSKYSNTCSVTLTVMLEHLKWNFWKSLEVQNVQQKPTDNVLQKLYSPVFHHWTDQEQVKSLFKNLVDFHQNKLHPLMLKQSCSERSSHLVIFQAGAQLSFFLGWNYYFIKAKITYMTARLCLFVPITSAHHPRKYHY